MPTLFRDGPHITDITVQHNGEIAVGSGGVGGEFYDRIPLESRKRLLHALAKRAQMELDVEPDEGSELVTIMTLFEGLFGGWYEDPYVAIGKFLRENNVPFKGDYWPDR